MTKDKNIAASTTDNTAMRSDDESKWTRKEMERDDALFYGHLNKVLKERAIQQKELLEALGPEWGDKSKLSRAIHEQKLMAAEKRKITAHLVQKRLIRSDFLVELLKAEEPLYHAFNAFYEIDATRIDNVRARVVGSRKKGGQGTVTATYALWRYSVEQDNEFVLGKLEFTESNGVVFADMYQPKKANWNSNQAFGQRASLEQFQGYLFRVHNMYLMMLKDMATKDFRVTIFPRHRNELINDPESVHEHGSSHIVHMDGIGVGMDGGSLFASPVYIELVDRPETIDQLTKAMDVLPEDKVPDRIVKKLKRMPRIMW